MKVISYSLYGVDQKYIVGAIENAKIARRIFSEWQCIFFCGKSIDESVLECLRSLGAITLRVNGAEDPSAMYWRFRIPELPQVERIIIRDTDSRLSFREKLAVDQWIMSGLPVHIMRDHISHNSPIMGGMWGMERSIFDYFRAQLSEAKVAGYYGEDQEFLTRAIYAKYWTRSCIHDSVFRREAHKQDFPSKRIGCVFIGESFSALNEVDRVSRNKLAKVENSKLLRKYVIIKDLIDLNFRGKN